MKIKWKTMFLSMLMVCAIIPLHVAAADTSNIYVGNVAVTEENANDILGDGSVSYDKETNTLTLENMKVTEGYKYTENFVTGIYAEGDLNLTLVGENNISVSDTGYASYGIYVEGNLSISGNGVLNATGGNVKGTQVETCGICVLGNLNINDATVYASGGKAEGSYAASYGLQVSEGLNILGGDVYCEAGEVISTEAEKSAAYSIGASVSNDPENSSSLELDFEGSLTATGAKASGYNAFSFGLQAYYANVAIYDGYLETVGSDANAINSAGSFGVQVGYAGLYVYESGANVTIESGIAEGNYAQSNGIYVLYGDVGIEAGTVQVKSGNWNGAEGNGHGILVEAYHHEDGVIEGGTLNIVCDNIFFSQAGRPGFRGTTVTISAANGDAVSAEVDVTIGETLKISTPEAGKTEAGKIVDAEGKSAQNVKVEPIIYKITIAGLKTKQSVPVPAGKSANEAYKGIYEADDLADVFNTKKEGYTFDGFFTDEACTDGNEYSFDSEVNENITIYAKWDKITPDSNPVDNEKDQTVDEVQSSVDKTTNSVQTGDNNSIATWIVLILVCVAAIGVIIYKKKK